MKYTIMLNDAIFSILWKQNNGNTNANINNDENNRNSSNDW